MVIPQVTTQTELLSMIRILITEKKEKMKKSINFTSGKNIKDLNRQNTNETNNTDVHELNLTG